MRTQLKRLRSRIERLERRIKGSECDGCIRTALAEVTGDKDPTSSRLSCPDCGNPNPKIPLWVIDELTSDEEAVARAEELVTASYKEHPECARIPKVKVPGDEHEQQ